MNLLLYFRLAIRGLSANKMRTALTMLGIVIGVAVVILVVAIGEGASQSVTDSINSLGTLVSNSSALLASLGESPIIAQSILDEAKGVGIKESA